MQMTVCGESMKEISQPPRMALQPGRQRSSNMETPVMLARREMSLLEACGVN
jgi:hypothetical protein